MELNGKKIAFLGDSITEGHGLEDVKDVFWNVLANRTGALCYGYGIGGTRIAPSRTPSTEKHDQYFGSRVDQMIPDADVIVVFGGTNDFGHGDAPFGAPVDRDPVSFCGALACLLEQLIERYPSAEIVVLTPLHRLTEEQTGLNERGLPRWRNLEGYVDAIREVSAWYGIPVLDLFRTSGIQPAVESLRIRYMPDGLHPNEAGHRLLASRLEGFLRSL